MEVIIQCHAGRSFFSRLIAWFSRSSISHISVWFHDPTSSTRGYVLEAVEGAGVREIPATGYQEARLSGKISLYRYRDPFTVEEAVELLEAMRKEVGQKYDWLGVFSFVTRRRHAHDEKWFCSEFLAYFSQEFGRPLFENTEAWEVKPADVPRSLALVRV